MKTPRYYAVRAFGMPGHPSHEFWDSYKTLTLARAAAVQAVRDGWRYCEILRDKKRTPDTVGIEREIIETLGQA